MWSFSVSELAIPGAEIGRISATDADLGENAKLEYTILEGESGDTFNITAVNQEAVITLNKVRGHWRGDKKKDRVGVRAELTGRHWVNAGQRRLLPTWNLINAS